MKNLYRGLKFVGMQQTATDNCVFAGQAGRILSVLPDNYINLTHWLTLLLSLMIVLRLLSAL